MRRRPRPGALRGGGVKPAHCIQGLTNERRRITDVGVSEPIVISFRFSPELIEEHLGLNRLIGVVLRGVCQVRETSE